VKNLRQGMAAAKMIQPCEDAILMGFNQEIYSELSNQNGYLTYC
jgi:hypothetical protein